MSMLVNSFMVSPSSYTFTNSEASALVARMSSEPDNARKALIDTFVGSLKSGGVWTNLDGLYVLAAHDSQAARLNWVSTSFDCTAVNAPTFTTDRGYAGDGASSYLDTNFNPSTAGGNYLQNDAHMGVWPRDASAAGDHCDIGNLNALIFPRYTGNLHATRANDGTSNLPASSAASGHFAWARSGSASYEKYYNASGSTVTQASTTVYNGNLFMLAFNLGGLTSPSTHQIALGHFGGNLSSGEMTALYNAANTYLVAVGAA